MIRKTLTIISLIGLLLSLGLWGASYLHVGCFLDESTNRFLLVSAGALH